MKIEVRNRKLTVSMLIMFGLVFLASSVVSVLATDFEVGTQFGISHLVSEENGFSTSITSTQIPSGLISTNLSLPSLYTISYPNNNWSVGPEFS